MFVFSNFIHAGATLINYILWLYMWIIIVRVVLSYFSPDPYNPIVQMLYRLTEPVLVTVRRRMPNFGGFDLSAFVVILSIYFLQNFLVRSLYDLARVMR